MTNYNNGKIYKIESLNGEEGDVYIGSTTKQYLSQRMTTHRCDFKRWKSGKRTDKVMSFDLFEKYGIKNCKIILLELVNANSKDELISRESHYIRTLNCLNKHIPDRTKEEWYAEYRPVYYEKNKEHILKKNKMYSDSNKEKISQQRQKYYQETREQKLAKAKEKYACECGSCVGIYDKQKHFRSKKHINYINSLTTTI
jgi:hypothetical protein